MDRLRQGKLLLHQVVLFGVLLILTGARLLMGRWEIDLYLLWWWLGALLGFSFIFLDRLYYAFWQHPEETLSIKMKDLIARGELVKGLVSVLEERTDQTKLAMRSVLFLGAWVVLGIFALTSVGAPFGRGFMLGMGLHLVFDLLADYFDRGRDVRLWFWQIRRELSEPEVRTVVWGFVILFVLIGWGL
ncbi:hypothetical protein [Candidatus Chazhemtobacterium aquaticus]|uniref:Uncharacterized protein n=1 Tax=Candidatus Chazhemtobacterium aquaticus TaxID=2715735 RepID=A0A857NBT1_9BACT|nr:hypothetical protein [Candidatus Chazhemtobacterium aquaticus]QHO63031.1 hypothetical protein MICH65_0050 [Candidatus Chazhemtobacterium aquaticus]